MKASSTAIEPLQRPSTLAAPAAQPTRAPEELLDWLGEHRSRIIEEWVERLSLLSASYRQRPLAELYGTVGAAFQADWEALSSGGLERIEAFIDYITELRLNSGFPLSDVQKAFELFRTVCVEMLAEQGYYRLLARGLPSINNALAYTICRFSDHFQHMHERAIRHYAQGLEDEVARRTAELEASRRHYQALVEEIGDGYFVIQDSRIIFANTAFCLMHRTTLEKVLGQPFLDFVTPACRDLVRQAHQDLVVGSPKAAPLEYDRGGTTPDKAATEIRARLVDLGQGPVVLGICRDISARKAMEAQVRDAERLAYVGRLAASLSHEIRNPLSAIQVNLQILFRKLDLDGYDQRRLEITVQQVSRLEGILRQLLDTARPLDLSPAPLDLGLLARGCAELLEPQAAAKELSLEQRHPGRLPLALLDAELMEQVVINLLLNAIDAAPAGSRVRLWTKTNRARDQVELGVRDSGPGLTPAERAQLFTPFFTTKPQGTGLGLSNLKRIVEAHAGTVEVRSRPGRGAAFLVRLPCRA